MDVILIDPYLLSCPNIESGKEQYEKFILNLIKWEGLLKCDWANIFLGNKIAEALFELNKYPMWERLAQANKRFEIDYIPTDAVARIISTLLTKFAFLENELQILEIEFDNFKTGKPKVLEREEEKLNAILATMLVCFTIHKQVNAEPINGVLATSITTTSPILYSFVLNDILFQHNAPASEIITIPMSETDEIDLFENFDELSNYLHFSLEETEIPYSSKPIKLSGDHHGNDKLLNLANKLVKSKLVTEVINNLPFNNSARDPISKIHSDGKIEITLTDTDEGFSMIIQTIGKNLKETTEVGKLLKKEFKL